jgi:multisubunit Na+/H+ antiporter MnhB subunit
VRPTDIVQNGADILVPLIAIFAAYIVMHGHLGPGGGFQGGAVMASCVLLLLLARPDYRIQLANLGVMESLAGLFIVFVGIAGIILAGGFLDNRVLPLGEFGAFFSAGAIPVLSVLLGVKVGCELSVIIERFRLIAVNRRGRDDLWRRSVYGVILILTDWGMLSQRDILRIIIGFVLMGTGSHLVIVAIGYVSNGRRPSSVAA